MQIQCNPYQNFNGIFPEIGRKILKFVWNKRPQITIAISRKKNRAEDIMLTISNHIIDQWYSKWYGIDIKTDIDQWNRMESSDINPHVNGQLIYDKGGKTIQTLQ